MGEMFDSVHETGNSLPSSLRDPTLTGYRHIFLVRPTGVHCTRDIHTYIQALVLPVHVLGSDILLNFKTRARRRCLA